MKNDDFAFPQNFVRGLGAAPSHPIPPPASSPVGPKQRLPALSTVDIETAAAQGVSLVSIGWIGPAWTSKSGVVDTSTRPTIVPPGMTADGSWQPAVVNERYMVWAWFPKPGVSVFVNGGGTCGKGWSPPPPMWLQSQGFLPASAPPHISPPTGATQDGPWIPVAYTLDWKSLFSEGKYKGVFALYVWWYC